MIPEGITFKVCWFYVGDNCPTLDYLLSLASSDKALFGSVVAKIRKLNTSSSFGLPDTRPLKVKTRGILELRVLGGNRMFARLPFILSSQREVIILFGETKKGGDPPPGFLKRAEKFKKQLDNEEANYEEIDFTIFDE